MKKRSRILRIVGRLALTAAALAGLAVLAYVVVFFHADRPVAALSERWLKPPERWVAVQGVQVHLLDAGPRDDRLPLVLLPGTDSGLQAFKPWATALAGSRRVITLDLPGFGLSDNMPEDDYTPETYARFVGALLDQLGLQRCVLVGHDFGGEVAWQTAYVQPERIAKLVLIAARGYPSDPWKRSLDDRLLRFAPSAWLGRITRSRLLVQRSLRDRYAHAENLDAEVVDRYFDLPLRSGNRRAQQLRLKQAREGAQADRIKGIQTPTLIVWGDNDRQLPAAQAFWFQHDIAGSNAVVVPELGHLMLEENPQATLDAVQDFIKR